MNPNPGISIPGNPPMANLPQQPAIPLPSAPASAVREWFTVALGGLIAAVALYLLVAHYFNPVAERKDVLTQALALLGTVTGYFLGRTPMEFSVRQAQTAASVAQQDVVTHRLETARVRALAGDTMRKALDDLPRSRAFTTEEEPMVRARRVLESGMAALGERP